MPFFISTKTYKQMPFPEVGRWHIVFRLMPNFAMNHTIELVIGVFKTHTRPEKGDRMTSKYYYGFLIARDFQWPLSIAGAWNLPTWIELKEKIKCLKQKLQKKMSMVK